MKFTKLRLLCAAAFISTFTVGAFADGIEGEEVEYNPNDVIIFDDYGSDSIVGDYPRMFPDDEDKNRLIGDYPELFPENDENNVDDDFIIIDDTPELFAADDESGPFDNQPELFSVDDEGDVKGDDNIGIYPNDDMRKFFANEENLRRFLGISNDMVDYFNNNDNVKKFFEYDGSKNNDNHDGTHMFAEPAKSNENVNNRAYFTADDDSIMFLEEPTGTDEYTVTDTVTDTITETVTEIVTETETMTEIVTETETVTEIVTETDTETYTTEYETNETLITDLTDETLATTDETLEVGNVTVEEQEGELTGEEGTIPQTGIPFDFLLAGFGTLIGISAFAASKKRPL